MKKPIGLLGIVGCVVCTVSMTLAAIGVAGAAATSAASGMAGMGGATAPAHQAAWLTFVLQYGPEILGVSVILVSISLFLKRKLAVWAGVGGGGILYWGMYLQPSIILMYGTAVVTMIIWGWAYVRYSPRMAWGSARRKARAVKSADAWSQDGE